MRTTTPLPTNERLPLIPKLGDIRINIEEVESVAQQAPVASDDNMFTGVPTDVIKLILNLLSLRDLASVARVNHRFHDITDEIVPHKLVVDSDTGESMLVPWMINDTSKLPSTYAQVRRVLVEKAEQLRKFNALDNNFIDKNIFKHDISRATSIPAYSGLCITLAGAGTLLYGAMEDNVPADFAGAAVMITGLTTWLFGMHYFSEKSILLSREKDALKAEIGDTLNEALANNGDANEANTNNSPRP